MELKENKFEFDGQSYLFWEYIRILEGLRLKNPELKFMLENVKMANKWKDMFSKTLDTEPIFINSNIMSAQNRPRLYWTNIELDPLPKDKNIILFDILGIKENTKCNYFPKEEIIYENIDNYHEEILTSTKNTFVMPSKSGFIDNTISLRKSVALRAGSSAVFTLDAENKIYRKLTVEECEKLQTIEPGYTSKEHKGKPVSNSQRYRMIGNGWTIDVICYLLKNVNKPIFKQIKIENEW